MSEISVLVIDDDITQIALMRTILESIEAPSCTVFEANDGPAGYRIILANHIDVVFTDYRMPNDNGLAVLRKIKQINPNIEIVVVTAHQDIRQSVQIMKHGALDYLMKPIGKQDIAALLSLLIERQHLIRESDGLRQAYDQSEPAGTSVPSSGIIAASSAMKEVLSLAARSANSDAAVLIRGETGTGKEVIAQAIHRSSNRAQSPFVSVNIAALPEELVESEVFGHTKGAFTGAVSDREGRFGQAEGGTLFVDEVGDIPADMQVKLLRVLQSGAYERVGENRSRVADVRIISATNQPLEERIKSGAFRLDFFYRLNVIDIHIPPLRERKADIEPLIHHFVSRYGEKNHRPIEGITREALDRLLKYEFPGNVRELENIIERAIVLSRANRITANDIVLPAVEGAGDREADTELGPGGLLDPYDLGAGYDPKLQAFERMMIAEALSRAEGNQSAAARLLGISERRLRSRMERLGP